MTHIKAGTALALTFAAGGGLGVYGSSFFLTEQDSRPPKRLGTIQVSAPAKAPQEGHSSQRVGEAVNLERASHPGEDDSDDEPLARSAADILWELELAYRNQELRIRSLEATLLGEENLEEQNSDNKNSDNEKSADKNHDVPSTHAAHNESASPSAPTSLVTAEVGGHRHEPPQVVVNINEPVAVAMVEAPPVAPANQQLVVVNYYQPLFVSDQAMIRPARETRGSKSFWDQRRSMQPTQQPPIMPSSWVASGFDVYSK